MDNDSPIEAVEWPQAKQPETSAMDQVQHLIHELTAHALQLKEHRQVLSKTLLEIRQLALDSIDGATETRGMDSRWTQVTEMVDRCLLEVSK